MALIHQATLEPTKIELLSEWLPKQSWYAGSNQIEKIASYRFDDPDGEVGMEGFLLDVGSEAPLHVALTYRAEPLVGAEEHLVGTTEHSVLGIRYVYDATGDPVWITALTTAIVTGGSGADEVTEVEGRPVVRETNMQVRGTGTSRPPIDTGAYEVVMVRSAGGDATDDQLIGTWNGRNAVLAGVRRRG